LKYQQNKHKIFTAMIIDGKVIENL